MIRLWTMVLVSLTVLLGSLNGWRLVDAGEYNSTLNIGADGPAWSDLPGVDDRKHSLVDLKDKQVVVVVFTCNSCPVAVDYEDRIIAFARQHAGSGGQVGLVAINVNRIAADSLAEMKKRAAEKGFAFDYLFDETQNIAKAYGAAFTPEFFVLDKNRKVAYMGGMDDNSNLAEVRQHYLEPAVAALLEGKVPKIKEAVARGCRIRYARQRD